MLGLLLALLIPSSPRNRVSCCGGFRQWIHETWSKTNELLQSNDRQISSGGLMPERIHGFGPEENDRREDVKHREVWFSPLPSKPISRPSAMMTKGATRRAPASFPAGGVTGASTSQIDAKKYSAHVRASYWSPLPLVALWKAVSVPSALALTAQQQLAIDAITGGAIADQSQAGDPLAGLGLTNNGIGSVLGVDLRQNLLDAINRGFLTKADATKIAENTLKRQQDLIGQGFTPTQAALRAAQEQGLMDRDGNPVNPNGGGGGGGGGAGGGGGGGGSAAIFQAFGAAAIATGALGMVGATAAQAGAATSIAHTNANASTTMAKINSNTQVYDGAMAAFAKMSNSLAALFTNRDQQMQETNRQVMKSSEEYSLFSKDLQLKRRKFYMDMRNEAMKTAISYMQGAALLALQVRRFDFSVMMAGRMMSGLMISHGGAAQQLIQGLAGNPYAMSARQPARNSRNGNGALINNSATNARVNNSTANVVNNTASTRSNTAANIRGMIADDNNLVAHAARGTASVPDAINAQGHSGF